MSSVSWWSEVTHVAHHNNTYYFVHVYQVELIGKEVFAIITNKQGNDLLGSIWIDPSNLVPYSEFAELLYL